MNYRLKELQGNRVALKLHPAVEKRTASGMLIIPNNVQEKDNLMIGTIITVGPGFHDAPMRYIPGQVVVFGSSAPVPFDSVSIIMPDGNEAMSSDYVWLDAQAIVAVVEAVEVKEDTAEAAVRTLE